MPKIKLTMADGQVIETEGRRFSHYVGNIQFWFLLHKPVDAPFGYDVSHKDSGKKVLRIKQTSLAACCGDEKAAAKMDLDALINRVGAPRVRSVLAGA